jgi:hypothetical protein
MKILLKKNEATYNELIELEQLKYNNGQTILAKLKSLGLSLTKVNDWTNDVEAEFMKDYPKANLSFNLSANGIETEYKEAEAYYLKYKNAMNFEKLTTEQAESIREEHRIYAESPAQIEAYELLHKTVDNLNRLIELGIPIDVNNVYDFMPIIYGDRRASPPFKLQSKLLVSTLTNLK